MAASLFVSPEARTDVTEAADYYESQRAGLGADFSATVANCLHAICSAPTRWPSWRGAVRRVRLGRFPHYLYFRYDAGANEVRVVTVFHPSRDPAELARRLGPS